MNNLLNLSPRALRKAADIQDRIVVLQNQMNQLLDFLISTAEPAPNQPRKRRRLSAQGLANIRAGARRRWAGFKKGGTPAKASRRRMSAAAKAKLAAIARARWRRAKASGRNAL